MNEVCLFIARFAMDLSALISVALNLMVMVGSFGFRTVPPVRV